MLSAKATELCRLWEDEQKNVALSQTTYAEAMKAMAASEEAVLESRNNFERTPRQCRIADRDFESRREESVWLHRKLKYVFVFSVRAYPHFQ
jgi:hypothetical protein